LPTLGLIFKTPEDNAPTSGTIIVERDTDSKATVGIYRDKLKNVYSATKDTFDENVEFGLGATDPNKKKRKGTKRTTRHDLDHN
jgi:hypothetical protein